MFHLSQGQLNSLACEWTPPPPTKKRSHTDKCSQHFVCSMSFIVHQRESGINVAQSPIKPERMGVTNIQSCPWMLCYIRRVSAYITSMFSLGFPRPKWIAALIWSSMLMYYLTGRLPLITGMWAFSTVMTPRNRCAAFLWLCGTHPVTLNIDPLSHALRKCL